MIIAEYDFNTPVTEDITLYAKWTVNSQPSSSSRNYGSSIWLTATPTPTPVPVETELTQAQPTASPVKPTPQASTPLPIAGIIAGLGAALVFGLRRK